MELPKEAIKEFRSLWKQHYNQELTHAEAEESARNLLQFVKVLIEIDNK